MGRFKETVKYTGRLLRDERGFIGAIIGAIAGAVGGLAGGVIGAIGTIAQIGFGAYQASAKGKAGRKAAKRAYGYQMLMEDQAARHKQAELDKILEIEMSKLEAVKASGFQKGTRGGPYFQAIRK